MLLTASPMDKSHLKPTVDGSTYSLTSTSVDSLPDRVLFDPILLPDDSYDVQGTYWADLPLSQRYKFVSASNSRESKREWRMIWENTKRNPFYPITSYFHDCVLPGAGLGLEG
jgi:hypothetical protein